MSRMPSSEVLWTAVSRKRGTTRSGGAERSLTARVLQNKHQAVNQGVRCFGKRSIFDQM
jgi:hypothetical protein